MAFTRLQQNAFRNLWLHTVFTQITSSYSNGVFGGTASKELKDIKTEICIKKNTQNNQMKNVNGNSSKVAISPNLLYTVLLRHRIGAV
jgi:hypothetical protein